MKNPNCLDEMAHEERKGKFIALIESCSQKTDAPRCFYKDGIVDFCSDHWSSWAELVDKLPPCMQSWTKSECRESAKSDAE